MWKFTDFLQVHGQIMFIVSFLLRFSYTQNFVTQDNNTFFNHPKILTVGLLCLLTYGLPNHVNIL